MNPDTFTATSHSRVVALVARSEKALSALSPTSVMLEEFRIVFTKDLIVSGRPTAPLFKDASAIIVACESGGWPGEIAQENRVPVIRVPLPEGDVDGLALLQDSQRNLPSGDAPFASVAIGEAGAKNAALFVVSYFALDDAALRAKWEAFRQRQTDAVLAAPPLPMEP